VELGGERCREGIELDGGAFLKIWQVMQKAQGYEIDNADEYE
jgi:hypothetical protein